MRSGESVKKLKGNPYIIFGKNISKYLHLKMTVLPNIIVKKSGMLDCEICTYYTRNCLCFH